jgi:lipoprotein NlpI
MITRDRKNDNAYFRRGIANLYAGALPRALSDMVHASELDPTYAYYAVWLDILSKRDHQASRSPQAVSQIEMTKWPAPIIRMFLGQVTPAAVLIAADDPDARTKKDQLCEANFYIGELALQQGTNEEATRRFRLAAADCPHRFNFVEGAAAYAELKALGVSPSSFQNRQNRWMISIPTGRASDSPARYFRIARYPCRAPGRTHWRPEQGHCWAPPPARRNLRR